MSAASIVRAAGWVVVFAVIFVALVVLGGCKPAASGGGNVPQLPTSDDGRVCVFPSSKCQESK